MGLRSGVHAVSGTSRPLAALLPVLLGACGWFGTPAPEFVTPAPAPAAVPSADAVAPAPPSEDDADSVWVDVLVRGPGAHIVGARLMLDGRVQQLDASRTPPVWKTTRRLTADQTSHVTALLDPAALDRLPKVLPPPNDAPVDAPEATWRVRRDGAWLAWRIPASTTRRVRPFDDLEATLRSAVPVEAATSAWTIHTGMQPWSFTLDCDPRDVAAVRGLAAHLRDPKLQPASIEPAAAPSVAVVWTRGLVSERSVLTVDGRVLRTDTDGHTVAVQLLPETARRLRDAVASLDRDAAPTCP